MRIFENKKELDATFSLEPGEAGPELVFESRGTGTSGAINRDYAEALELLLGRLKSERINVIGISLHPKNRAPGSSLELGKFGPPVLLDRVEDLRALRLAISRAQAQMDRGPRARGGGNPTRRIRMFLDAHGADVNALERRLAGTSGRRFWALFANPKVYRIDAAIAAHAEDLWTTRGKDVRAGDRAMVWRGRGGGLAARGVVAFGEVLTDPRDLDDPENSYWVHPAERAKRVPRVKLRYVVPAKLPLLEQGNHRTLLADLSVARARGGTVFEVEERLFARILAAAGGWLPREETSRQVGHRGHRTARQ